MKNQAQRITFASAGLLLLATCVSGAGFPAITTVSGAEALKAHILSVRGVPLTDMDVRTVIQVTDYGALPDDDKNDWSGIQQAISAAALAKGPVLVRFEKGRYQAYKDGTSADAVITIINMQNMIVDGQGAEVIIQSPYLSFSYAQNSSNIIVRNFEIDYDPLPFTQGTVVAVDNSQSTFDLEVDAGFPAPDAAFFMAGDSWGMLKDPAYPGRLKPDSSSYYRRTACVPVGENRFRITPEVSSQIAHFSTGDRYAQVARIASIGRTLLGDQVTFMNLTAYACPSALFIGDRTSHINILNCRAILKDGRLLTAGADGVHVQAARIGPWVEGCYFEGLSDDGCNFYSIPIYVQTVLGPRSLSMIPAERVRSGDRLAFFQPQSGRILAEMTVEQVAGSVVTFTSDLPALSIATNGTPYNGSEWKIYDHAYNLDATGNFFVFRNNTVRNGRRYGSYFKASYGLISGNHFEGLSHAGMTFFNEPGWPEGFYAHNIIVAENTIRDCASMDSAALKVSFQYLGTYTNSPDGGNHANFFIYRNNIENPSVLANKVVLNINRLDGVTLSGNRLVAGGSNSVLSMKDSMLRSDVSAKVVAEEFVRTNGFVAVPSEVPALLGSNWLGGAGTRWEISNQELSMSGTNAHVYNVAGHSLNSGDGNWFIVAATVSLNTTNTAQAGLILNYDDIQKKFLIFRFDGQGRIQLVRPNGTTALSKLLFTHIQNRPYRLTAASFNPHSYYLEVTDTVTGDVLYSGTTVNTQSATNGLSNGCAGLFSSTNAAVFQDFQVWNSGAEPVFTPVRGVPVSWYAAQGISPQSEGVSSWEALDEIDSTGQGRPNWQVYAGGTDPSDPAAIFTITRLSRDAGGHPCIEWLGGTNGAAGSYVIQYTENLSPSAIWRYLTTVQGRTNGTNQWIGLETLSSQNGFFRVLADPKRF